MDPAQREGRSRHQGRDESEDDGVLVDVGEDDRGDESHQEPADQPAGRDQEVEAGEVGGRRAQAGEGAVAAECRQGEDDQVNETEREDRAAHRIDDREEDERQRQHARKDARRNQLAPREGVDEGAEIERERHDPEERHRRHVGGQVSRDREEERAGNGRQREDAHHGQPGPGGETRRRDRRGRRRAAARRCHPENDEQRCKAEEDGAPEPGLTVQPEQGLEQEGIGQEGACGARVRGRVQEVGVDRGRAAAGPCKPRLDQRGEGRGGDEGEPERACQRAEQPDDGRKVAGRVAHEAKLARRRREGHTDPENPEQGDLPGGRHVTDEKVREGIARQQRRLEEHHGSIPDRRRAAEDGQDVAHRQRLYPEHQRRGEDDEAVEPGRGRDVGRDRAPKHALADEAAEERCGRRPVRPGPPPALRAGARRRRVFHPDPVRHAGPDRSARAGPLPGTGVSADARPQSPVENRNVVKSRTPFNGCAGIPSVAPQSLRTPLRRCLHWNC